MSEEKYEREFILTPFFKRLRGRFRRDHADPLSAFPAEPNDDTFILYPDHLGNYELREPVASAYAHDQDLQDNDPQDNDLEIANLSFLAREEDLLRSHDEQTSSAHMPIDSFGGPPQNPEQTELHYMEISPAEITALASELDGKTAQASMFEEHALDLEKVSDQENEPSEKMFRFEHKNGRRKIMLTIPDWDAMIKWPAASRPAGYMAIGFCACLLLFAVPFFRSGKSQPVVRNESNYIAASNSQEQMVPASPAAQKTAAPRQSIAAPNRFSRRLVQRESSESGEEVIVRHFSPERQRPTVLRAHSGVKVYSDLR